MTRLSNPTFNSLVWCLLLVCLLVPLIDGCTDDPLSQSNPIPSSVQLDRVQPSVWSTVGGVPLHLYGHGFEPGTKVQLNDEPPMEGRFVSEQELEIMLPSRIGQIGPVRISIIPPRNDCWLGTCAVTRNDLFRYSASHVAFARPPQVIPTGDSSCKDGRLFWLEQQAERTSGVVMFCNQETSLPARLFLFRQSQDGSLGPRERLWTGDMDIKSVALNNCQSGYCSFIVIYSENLKPGGTIQVLEYRNGSLNTLQKIDAAPEYWWNGDESIFSGDVNGDKQEDVIRLVHNGDHTAVYSIFRKSSGNPFDKDGIFEELPSPHHNIIAAADLDRDGKTDLITEGDKKRWIVWNDYQEWATLYAMRLWNEEEFVSSEPGVPSAVKVLQDADASIIVSERDLERNQKRYRIFQKENGTTRGLRVKYTFSLAGIDVGPNMHFDLTNGLTGSALTSLANIGLQHGRLGEWNAATGDVSVDASTVYQVPSGSIFNSQSGLLVRDLDNDGRQDAVAIAANGIYVIQTVRSATGPTQPGTQPIPSNRKKFFSDTVQSMQVMDINHDGADDILLGTNRGLKVVLGSSSGDYHETTHEAESYQEHVILSISEIPAAHDSMSSQREFLAIMGKQGAGIKLIHAGIDEKSHIHELRRFNLSSYFCPDAACGGRSSYVATLTNSRRNQVEIIVSDHDNNKLILVKNWNMVGSIDLAQISPICRKYFQLQSIDLDGDDINDLILLCTTENIAYVLKTKQDDSISELSARTWRPLHCDSGSDLFYDFPDRHVILSKGIINNSVELFEERNHGWCGPFIPCKPEIVTKEITPDLTGCNIVSIVPSSERRLCGVVDIDGDGKSESVTCFGNQTYLKRDDQSLVPVAQGQFAAAGDMNGDGKKDLILKEDQGLVIYENLSQ